MTKTQMKQALQKDQERKRAKQAERIVLAGYPWSHNPYIAHTPLPDCYAGCKLEGSDNG